MLSISLLSRALIQLLRRFSILAEIHLYIFSASI